MTAGPPLTVTGLTVPAGGNALLVYEAAVTRYAPLDQEAAITNTATVTGGGLAAPLTAQATLAAAQRADLTVSKAICPATVTESGQLTYTFVLQNFGNTAATAGDNVILTDTFDPALTGLTVTYNGDAWKEGDNYTYDAATGTFCHHCRADHRPGGHLYPGDGWHLYRHPWHHHSDRHRHRVTLHRKKQALVLLFLHWQPKTPPALPGKNSLWRREKKTRKSLQVRVNERFADQNLQEQGE